MVEGTEDLRVGNEGNGEYRKYIYSNLWVTDMESHRGQTREDEGEQEKQTS